jgi:Uncharacterized protein, putative amidase
MRLNEITSGTFAEQMKNDPWVIIPLGAVEAHGPHLPLGTDIFQPDYVLSKINEILGDRVIIAPIMPYGQHYTARGTSGTIDISFDTLRSFVRDILNAFIRHGAKRIMILSGHAGNSHIAAVTEACREIVNANSVEIMLLSEFHMAKKYGIPEGDEHAGLMETSRMLHIRPDLVGNERPKGSYKSAGYHVLRDARARLPNGVSGDTKGASLEFGEQIDDFIIKEIKKILLNI